MLIISSILLYLGGLVSNDFFDIKADKIERPSRPLVSGAIQKKVAVTLVILFFVSGCLLSLLVNITSTAVAVFLITLIILYNFKLKNGFYRPFIMGSIRSLNIIFGFSSFIGFFGAHTVMSSPQIPFGYNTEPHSFMLLSLVCISIFFHIFMLTFVSSKETSREFSLKNKLGINIKKIFYVYISFLIIIGIIGTLLVEHPRDYLVFLIILGISSSLVYYKAHQKILNLKEGSLAMQFIVKNMITLLILLDSTFIAGISGALIGLVVAFFIFPVIFLSKKINMT